ncbi:MAG: cation-translocating P-type ATPase [Clostridiaceae bacterium]|nr:cation-translocating P-type ATPase [Clostridiaceae bacterium]
MKSYSHTFEEVALSLGSSDRGLSEDDVEHRRLEHGRNLLHKPPKPPLIKRFLSQLADPMTLILIVAAVISLVTAIYSGEGFADVIIIMAVVIVNACLGVYQESKAEKAIEALQAMSAATCRTVRDGKTQIIRSEDLVPGDIILLEAGDAVPADGRLFESFSLKIEEAALTGESVPVSKITDALGLDGEVALGDRKNMVYMGSAVAYGRGAAIVTETGMKTEMGKIADALAKAKEGQTPLQIKLSHLSRILSYLVISICAFIFAFSLIRNGQFSGEVILDTFMVAVSLAVAAIPEGLATVVTIVLSIGVTNMSKRNAIIRKLTAVETLGCTQIICSDKTGTLTQNKMTVVDEYTNNRKLLATAMALCSDAKLEPDHIGTIGEPTECALVRYSASLNLYKPELEKEAPRKGEAPFDSGRKMMSTIHLKEDTYIQYTKGAPDEVLLRCTKYLDDNGNSIALTNEVKAEILDANKEMASKALRVLAAAFKELPSIPQSLEPEALEQDLTFIGLCGMIDPVRPEVKDAIALCRTSGIRPVMITGDHKDTAAAIAKELGMITSDDQAITGLELSALDDESFSKRIEDISVYARVQPEHKVRIVNAWQEKGYITAMTGDGVNDAPSIKTADIGVGMGITGTDVTKNVADMVLADDNFATIVSAVEEGRRIYDNIRKSVQFLLSSNLSEVLSIFFATLLGFTILKPVHLLWINLITDCFPAMALGVEIAEPGIMNRKPRPAKENLFADKLGLDIFIQGFLITLLTLAAYFIGHYMEAAVWEIANSPDGMTMAFLTLSMTEICHSFNMRSQNGSVFSLPSQNHFLWWSALTSLALTSAVIYIPFLSNAFGFQPISIREYLTALILAFSIIPLVELQKLIKRKSSK